MRKICCWLIEAVELILLLLLLIVMTPFAIVDVLLCKLYRKLHREDPERMTDEERRRYYGYDKGW